MAKPEDELKDLLEYDGSRKISDGDLKFIETCANQIKNNRPISTNQAPIISKIWDRYCGGT